MDIVDGEAGYNVMTDRRVVINDERKVSGHLRLVVEYAEKRREREAFSWSLLVKGGNR
jgi:hypothetical protein